MNANSIEENDGVTLSPGVVLFALLSKCTHIGSFRSHGGKIGNVL